MNLGFLVPITSPLLVCIYLPTISTFVNPVLPRIKMVKLVKGLAQFQFIVILTP